MTPQQLFAENDDVVEITIIGEPKTKGSWRPIIGKQTGKVVMIPSGADKGRSAKDWQSRVASCASEAMAGRPPFDGPLAWSMVFVLPRPKSIKPNKRPYPHVKPDIDKLLRAVMDGLKGIVYHDDCQPVRCTRLEKLYADDGLAPGVHITMQPLEG